MSKEVIIKRYGMAQLGLFMIIMGIVFTIYGNQELSSNEPQFFPEDESEEKSGFVAIVILGVILVFCGFITIIFKIISKEEKLPHPQDKYCTNCKRQIPVDSILCPYCATKIY